MKAMILAAGMGTRLRPLTASRPKALVEVAGRTLLEIALSRLRSFGVTDVIVNVHHFSEMVTEYLQTHHNFGMRVAISQEEMLLDTGGGLKNAGWFFQEQGGDEPFILHNVDVISTIDLGRMLQAHRENDALATLAVRDRPSSRQLFFNDHLQLCGRRAGSNQEPEIVRPAKNMRALAFSGIHIVSPRMLPMMTQGGAFSIIATYLDLAARGEKILAFRADEYYWRDLGRPEDLAQADVDFQRNLIP